MLGLCALLIAVLSIQPIYDHDVWWHLASGRWMWEHHAVLRADPFSFTVFGRPWIDHEWFFEGILYLSHRLGGFHGVLLLKTACLAISVVGFWRLLTSVRDPFFRAAITLATYAVILWLRNMARADLISLMVFPWMLEWVYETLSAQRKTIFSEPLRTLLPRAATFILWVNSHAAFWSFWMWILLVAAVRFVTDVRDKKASFEKALRQNTPAQLFLFTAALSLVNPYGLSLLTGTFKTAHALISTDIGAYREYSRTPFREFACYWAALAAAWIGLLWKTSREKKLDRLRWITLVFATWISHAFVRNIPLALFWWVPVAATLVPTIRNKYISPIITAIALSVFLVLRVPRFGWGVQRGRFPVGAASFMEMVLPPGPVYNDYDFGGFLIWKLYGKGFPVFVDGRMHAIEGYTELGRSTRPLYGIGSDYLPTWKQVETTWAFDYALVKIPPIKHPWLSLFSYQFPKKEWALIYADRMAALYVRRKDIYHKLIDERELYDVYPDVSGHARLDVPWDDLTFQSR